MGELPRLEKGWRTKGNLGQFLEITILGNTIGRSVKTFCDILVSQVMVDLGRTYIGLSKFKNAFSIYIFNRDSSLCIS